MRVRFAPISVDLAGTTVVDDGWQAGLFGLEELLHVPLIGPVLVATFKWGDWEHPAYVLMLYAVIAVIDGIVLQPYLMKRSNRVPVWASILAPIVLGFVIPFWGVLLAPPLLAVIYAFRRPKQIAGGS